METILGIDLGTTNSEVAIIRNDKVEVLHEDGEAILPSVVGLDANGRLLVGAAARNQWVLAPERTVRSIKRRMGTAETVRLGDQAYTPQEISAFILRKLKERAEKQLGHGVHKAVITVPAFFNETQREATREAGELAGLEVLRIINEPTAASLTYDPHPEKMERLLVYDLGGGTFDVSIVQIEQGVVEVLSSHGDTHLGGDDFDQLLADLVCDDFHREHGIDLRQSPAGKSRVLRAVEEAKKRLSFEAVAQIEEEFIAEKQGAPLHLRREIHRDEYEELIEPLLAKTLKCVDQSLSDAKLNANQIDKVVLVGGASRTPRVHQLLEEQLGQPIHAEVDPDLCVAMGAAIQGGLIAGIDIGPVLVDITPHTLGVRALGEVAGRVSHNCFVRLIQRNSPLPSSRSEILTTVYDGQNAARIMVFQGEDDDVRHNDPVGEFLLDGLADVAQGNEILVRFDLNLDGILEVSATERATGRQKQLTIDNAVTRFRASNRQEALARVKATFSGEPGTPTAGAETEAATAPAPPPADLPAEMAQLIDRCEELIAKSGKLVEQSNPADAAEMRQLVEQLRAAMTVRLQADMEDAAAKLEDLVFYLQDA
ncbi:MAG: Hsp70 family protein [Thermoguttaceae bacterium]|jgi:molecular chaperone DnaK